MRKYLVELLYREPLYAKTRGIPEIDYRATFEVLAGDPRLAELAARRRFRAAGKQATVSWAREIVFAKVSEVEPAASCSESSADDG